MHFRQFRGGSSSSAPLESPIGNRSANRDHSFVGSVTLRFIRVTQTCYRGINAGLRHFSASCYDVDPINKSSGRCSVAGKRVSTLFRQDAFRDLLFDREHVFNRSLLPSINTSQQVRTMPQSPTRKYDEPTFEQLIHADLPLHVLRRRIVEGITDFDRSFRQRFPVIWFSTFVGPFLVVIATLLSIGVVYGWSLSLKFLVMGLATFVLFGRLVILGGIDKGNAGFLADYSLSPIQLFGMVTFMDCLVAMFVTFHMGILFRIPWAGKKIAGLTCDSKFIMDQQPWMRRLAFVALVSFVMFPTSTTGSIGGSIFGRLLGLGRFRTLLGVFTGSVLGNGLMYFFAREINKIFEGPNKWVLTISGILLMVATLIAVEIRYRKAKQQYIADYEERHASDKNSEIDKSMDTNVQVKDSSTPQRDIAASDSQSLAN